VSAWWADEARRYGLAFDTHDDRYARTRDWLAVVDGLWREPAFTHRGSHYTVEDAIVAPKPVSKPRPTLYAGGESEAAKEMIASVCDAYVMHGDSVDRIRTRIQDMLARRDRLGLPPMRFGMAAYAIVRDSRREAEAELARITNVHASAAGYQNYRQWLENTQQEAAPSLA
jgi:FMNH2-dependent dimethyl sulfone monooxygenase